MTLRMVALLCVGLSCGGTAAPAPQAPNLALVGPGDAPLYLRSALRSTPLTVLVFFSSHCHCLSVHEPRLRALYEAYHPSRVQFFMVDSEANGTRERDDREAAARGLPFPILLDRRARLADALGAEYATYSVVLDSEGRVRYHGGIDTDKTHLHDDATLYLQNAIADLLAGRPLRVESGKTLGCALEKW